MPRKLNSDNSDIEAVKEKEVDEEIKIDLMKYVETLVRQWLWIGVWAAVLGVVAGAFTLLNKFASPSYRATAVVSSARTVSAVNFGSAITSQSETDLASAASSGAQYLYDRNARLQSFVALVPNGAVAEQVLEVVGPKLAAEERNTTSLLNMVGGNLIKNTDSIQVSITYKNPTIAAEIANAWAEAYVQRINELYGSSSGSSYLATEAETKKAKASYEKAQATLDDFIAHNMIDEYTRQTEEITVLITSLRGARSTSTTTIVDAEVAAEQKVIDELYSALTSNQLLALQQDQQSRRDLITAYINALSQGRQDAFNQQAQDRLERLDQAYTDSRRVDSLLANAVSMRAAVNTGGDSAARSNALALTLLKTQIYADFTGSNNLQIQNLPETLGSTIGAVDAVSMVTDLDALIATLKTRQTELLKLISTLSSQIQNQADLQVSDTLESTGGLAKTIQDRYPELFQLGKLSAQNMDGVQSGNPLATEALQRSQALLQLKGLENLVNFSVDTPIERVIEENEQKLRDLNAQISQETSTQTVLTRERDLAWTTYSALNTKSAEMNVASQTTGVEVVFASPATPPDQQIKHTTTSIVYAGAVGLAIGLISAYAYELWQNYKKRKVEIIFTKVFTYIRDFDFKYTFKSMSAGVKQVFTRKSIRPRKAHK